MTPQSEHPVILSHTAASVVGLAALAVLVGANTTLAAAQDSPPTRRATGAPPEMQKLASMAGEWQIHGEARAAPDQAWKPFETESRITAILKGAHLQESMLLPQLSGPPIELLALWSYDRFRRVYRMAYLDDTYALFDVNEGSWENDRLVFTNLRVNTPIVAGGQTIHSKITLSSLGPDGFHLENEVSTDAGKTWWLMVRGDYVRKR